MSSYAFTVGAGLLAGLVYALSPVGVCSLAALIAVAWGTARIQPPRERRVFLLVVASSVAARVAALAVFVLVADPGGRSVPTMFGDEYLWLRRPLWLNHIAQGIPIRPANFTEAFDTFGSSGTNYFFAAIQLWLGEAPYALHLMSVAAYVIGAMLLYRTARAAFGPVAATVGLVLTLFMPTLFVWSIAVMKESYHFLINAAALTASVSMLRRDATLRARLLAAAVLALSLASAAALRAGALPMLAAGIAGGALLHLALASRRRLLGATAVLVIAVAAGAGIQPLRAFAVARIQGAAIAHLGHVQSPGHSYTLLDRRFYAHPAPPMTSMTSGEMTRFLSRAAASIVVVPLPWETRTRSELLFVPQQMAWYLLVVLAIPGAIIGLRRHRAFTCVLLGVAAAGAAGIAPNNGNIGTMVRLRDLVVVLVIWISAVGAERILTVLARSTARWPLERPLAPAPPPA